MPETSNSQEQGKVISTPEPAARRKWARFVPRFRFDRSIGFGLGGLMLGTVGRLYGASMSHSHPVTEVASVLWWGIYFGCLGASIGALVGILVEQARKPAFLAREDV
jgi:hypothetical protein